MQRPRTRSVSLWSDRGSTRPIFQDPIVGAEMQQGSQATIDVYIATPLPDDERYRLHVSLLEKNA